MRLLFLLLLGCSSAPPPAEEPVEEVVAPAPLPTSLPDLRKPMDPLEPQVGLVEVAWSAEGVRARAVWTEAGQYGLVLGAQAGFRPDLKVELGAGCQLVGGDWPTMMKRLPRAFRAFDVPSAIPILLGGGDDARVLEVAAALRSAGYSTLLRSGDGAWATGGCADPAADGAALAARRARFEAQAASVDSAGALDALLEAREAAPPDPSEGAIDP